MSQSTEPEPPRASTKATVARKHSLLIGRNLEQNPAHKGDPSAGGQPGKEIESGGWGWGVQKERG